MHLAAASRASWKAASTSGAPSVPGAVACSGSSSSARTKRLRRARGAACTATGPDHDVTAGAVLMSAPPPWVDAPACMVPSKIYCGSRKIRHCF